MKNKIIAICCSMLLFSCVSSSRINKDHSYQDNEALQKQALESRVNDVMAEQNRLIDSLIAAADKRLKKDKNGDFLRPNWVSQNGKPLYYSKNKRSVRQATKASALGSGGSLGLDLSGEGIHIGIWDAGHILINHEAFTGGERTFSYEVPIEISDASVADVWDSHPTAVASILIAKDVLGNQKYESQGVTPKLNKVYSYDWDDDLYEILDQLQTDSNPNFILSNHSYGIPLLDEDGELLPNELIGNYSIWSSILDNITNVYPYYLHVAAGGNDGDVMYPTQQVAGLDQLTGSTTAKNVLTVGSLSMDYNSSNFAPSEFSSAGPTNDFRIKPEITAPGEELVAASWDEYYPDYTELYEIVDGTSFSSPAVAGGVALLQQLYKQTYNKFMRGATVKALLCHTADDIKIWNTQDISGPDVKTGYGAINLKKAAEIILEDEFTKSKVFEFDLRNNETKTFYLLVSEAGEVKATLSWFDPEAEENAGKTLVNDLDLRILENETTYLPWKLSTETQAVTAILGDNDADNLEQVVVSESSGEIFEIKVSHKGSLSQNQQQASIIITGSGLLIPSVKAFEYLKNDGFLVAPNPVIGEYFSVFSLDNTFTFRSLLLSDLVGREVARISKSSFSTSEMRFDVDHLTSGVYILGIETKDDIIYNKLYIK